MLNHPDINKSPCSWEDSASGKIYKALHQDALSPYNQLMGKEDKKVLVKMTKPFVFTRGKFDTLLLNNLINKSSNTIFSTFSIKSLKGNRDLQFKTLIDSGAIDANFISLDSAEALKAEGYIMENCNSKVDMGVRDLSQRIFGKCNNLKFVFLIM